MIWIYNSKWVFFSLYAHLQEERSFKFWLNIKDSFHKQTTTDGPKYCDDLAIKIGSGEMIVMDCPVQSRQIHQFRKVTEHS